MTLVENRHSWEMIPDDVHYWELGEHQTRLCFAWLSVMHLMGCPGGSVPDIANLD